MRRTGLIGRTLKHSLSPQIHKKFYELTGIPGEYALYETSKNNLGDLVSNMMTQRYIGVNVTIPYKTEVIKHLNLVTDEAAAIGAVNTILFNNGKKIGYNTDYFGLKTLLETNDIALTDKCVIILGTGGAARCAFTLAQDEDAATVHTVSRNPSAADKKLSPISYDAMGDIASIDVLINTTPVGMSPNENACPASDSVIEKCAAVVDLIYNPEQTMLLKKASALGRQAVGGMLMLVAQAIKAQEIWTKRKYPKQVYQDVLTFMEAGLYAHQRNIVLIGMPSSGKSAIGRQLAERLNMGFVDTDEMIEQQHGSITEIFAHAGESVFREFERTTVADAAKLGNTVISTGGGVVLDERNMQQLKTHGVIVFIDRPLRSLLANVDIENRPLLSEGKHKLMGLYTTRIPLYKKYADLTAQNSGAMETCITNIINQWEANNQ